MSLRATKRLPKILLPLKALEVSIAKKALRYGPRPSLDNAFVLTTAPGTTVEVVFRQRFQCLRFHWTGVKLGNKKTKHGLSPEWKVYPTSGLFP